MQVTSRGPSLDFRDEDEAEAFGHHLATALRLAYDARGVQAPWLLRAARDYLAAEFGATRGRADGQARPRRGLSETAPGRGARGSDKPARLTVSVNEAATLAEVHPRTVRKWIAGGTVEAARGPRGAYRVGLGSLATKISQRREENDEHEAA